MGITGTANVAFISSELHDPWINTLRAAAKDAMRVRTLHFSDDLSNDLSNDHRRFASMGVDSPALLMLWDDNFAQTLDIVQMLRRHYVEEPILVVTSEQDEERLVAFYTAGVDECIHAGISMALLLAKLRVWLHWATIDDSSSNSSFFPC